MWHKPGAPVVNPKRRWIEGAAEESEEDKDAWEHVDMEAWEKVWSEWDAVRARIMDGKEHWCASRPFFLLSLLSRMLNAFYRQTCALSGSFPATKASASAAS